MPTVGETGLGDEFTVNGQALKLPPAFEPAIERREAYAKSFNGRWRVTRMWDGEGLPDILDVYEFPFEYELDDDDADTVRLVEKLRVLPGPHDFCWWKKRYAAYTATSGQTVFKLPRPDAYSELYPGHDAAADQAVITVNDVAVPVTYAESVTSETVVAAGQVHISKTAVEDDDTGMLIAVFKFGTALPQGAVVLVEYYPLFRVHVREVSTRFGEKALIESKAIYFVEVNG